MNELCFTFFHSHVNASNRYQAQLWCHSTCREAIGSTLQSGEQLCGSSCGQLEGQVHSELCENEISKLQSLQKLRVSTNQGCSGDKWPGYARSIHIAHTHTHTYIYIYSINIERERHMSFAMIFGVLKVWRGSMCVHLFFFPKAFPKSQLENMAEDRNMIHVALCGRTPEIKDPFIIEPKKEDPNKARWCEKRT